MADPSRRRLPYAPALDGVRALAVSGVLVFHAELAWLPGGFLGVSTFFTLSGFLIGSLLMREIDEDGRIGFGRFWIRRFRRLMPAAFLGVALGTACTLAVGSPEAMLRLRGEGLSALFYYSNWFFHWSGQSYAELFLRPSALQHYWSLSIEEQFYLVFPPSVAALTLATRRVPWAFGAALALGALASLGTSLHLVRAGAESLRLYYGTDTRAAELLVGALLAVWLRGGRGRSALRAIGPAWLPQLAGMAGLLVSGALWLRAHESSLWLFQGGVFAHALATAGLLWACVSPGPIARALAWRPLVALGRISYGVYVYHWPVYLWLDLGEDGTGRWLEVPLQVGLTLLLAVLSHRFVEQPIRSGARLTGVRGLAAAGAAAAASVGLLAYVAPAPSRELLMYARARGPMIAGSTHPDATRILLVGDSLAVSLFLGLERWATQRDDVRVISDTRQCALARAPERKTLYGAMATSEACRTWRAGLRGRIEGWRPDVVLVVGGFWELQDVRLPGWRRFRHLGDPVFDAWLLGELGAAVAVLTSSGAPLVWLTAPCPGTAHLATRLRSFGGTRPERFDRFNRQLLPALAARSAKRMQILDLDGRVCPDGVFQMRLGDVERARPDGLHFSLEASARLAQWLGPEALRVARGDAKPPP